MTGRTSRSTTSFVKMYDKNGKLFDPAEYASYSTTSSYIDYSVNRVNDRKQGE